jgi:hypothetical protein
MQPNDVTVIEPTPQLPARRESKAVMVAGGEVAAFYPRSLNEVAQVADAIMRAGLVPSSYEVKLGTQEQKERETKSRLMVGIMQGLEVGFGPITALKTIAVINNRPSIWGDGAVALAQRSGAVEWVKQTYTGEESSDDWTATYTIKRRGQPDPYVGTFSVRDAKRAHLWMNASKKPWIEYPQRMLMARARAYALRDGFADCLMGLSIAEEVQDLPEAPPAKIATDFLDDAPALNSPSESDATETEAIIREAEETGDGVLADEAEHDAREAGEVDEVAENLERNIEALINVSDLITLHAKKAEIVEYLKAAEREDLIGRANTAFLERERTLGRLKAKK